MWSIGLESRLTREESISKGWEVEQRPRKEVLTSEESMRRL